MRMTEASAGENTAHLMTSSLNSATKTMQSLSGSASLKSKAFEELNIDEGGLIELRFEITSRWEGRGRGPTSKRPMAEPVSRPSPVTCLTTLLSALVAGYESGNIFVWDITGVSQSPLHNFNAHTVAVNSLSYVPALDALVTSGKIGTKNDNEKVLDSKLKVWNCSTMDLRQTLSLHSAEVRNVQALRMTGAKDPPTLAISCDTRMVKHLRILKLGSHPA